MVRITALLTAIVLSLARAHWVWTQVTALRANFRWTYVPLLSADFLFLLPFPVLLAMLYCSSGVRLAISAGLKRLLLVAVLLQGVLYTGPVVYGWIRSLNHGPVASQWSGALAMLAPVTILFFLLALYFHPSESGIESRLLRETAALATMTAGLAIGLSLAVQVYAMTMLRRQQSVVSASGNTWGQFIVRIGLSSIPQICELVAAYTLYRSQLSTIPEPVAAGEALPQLPIAGG